MNHHYNDETKHLKIRDTLPFDNTGKFDEWVSPSNIYYNKFSKKGNFKEIWIVFELEVIVDEDGSPNHLYEYNNEVLRENDFDYNALSNNMITGFGTFDGIWDNDITIEFTVQFNFSLDFTVNNGHMIIDEKDFYEDPDAFFRVGDARFKGEIVPVTSGKNFVDCVYFKMLVF